MMLGYVQISMWCRIMKWCSASLGFWILVMHCRFSDWLVDVMFQLRLQPKMQKKMGLQLAERNPRVVGGIWCVWLRIGLASDVSELLHSPVSILCSLVKWCGFSCCLLGFNLAEKIGDKLAWPHNFYLCVLAPYSTDW